MSGPATHGTMLKVAARGGFTPQGCMFLANTWCLVWSAEAALPFWGAEHKERMDLKREGYLLRGWQASPVWSLSVCAHAQTHKSDPQICCTRMISLWTCYVGVWGGEGRSPCVLSGART